MRPREFVAGSRWSGTGRFLVDFENGFGRQAGWSVDYVVWLVGWLVGWLIVVCALAGCLVDSLVGWWSGCLVVDC